MELPWNFIEMFPLSPNLLSTRVRFEKNVIGNIQNSMLIYPEEIFLF